MTLDERLKEIIEDCDVEGKFWQYDVCIKKIKQAFTEECVPADIPTCVGGKSVVKKF